MSDSHIDSGADESADSYISFIIAFDVLQIVGLIFLVTVLCVASFSSRIRRSTTWFAYTIVWTLSCVSYLLILRHQTGPMPGHIICLCQAMLIYAFPVLNSLTFAIFTLEIFLSISDAPFISRTTMMSLYFLPYGVFVGILVEVLTLGLLNPKTILREPFGMFCHISNRIPLRISSAIVICCMLASLTLAVRIALICRRQWSATKLLLIRNKTPFGLVLRVGLIGFCSFLSIGLAVIDMFKPSALLTVSSNIVLAMLPSLVAIIFGSQGDILPVLMFWRNAPQTLPTLSTEFETITNTKNSP